MGNVGARVSKRLVLGLDALSLSLISLSDFSVAVSPKEDLDDDGADDFAVSMLDIAYGIDNTHPIGPAW